MFVGHVAAAMIAKRVEPGVERYEVLAGVQRNLFLGTEIAYSLSLPMDVFWGTALLAIWF
jgi:hypothetical protein